MNLNQLDSLRDFRKLSEDEFFNMYVWAVCTLSEDGYDHLQAFSKENPYFSPKELHERVLSTHNKANDLFGIDTSTTIQNDFTLCAASYIKGAFETVIALLAAKEILDEESAFYQILENQTKQWSIH